ncbi:LacI family DNA-binding transcriptional regulator [Limibaculum sp. M0105]|uniref:LacI family DNA-binding transcriptional regulator n=1 Tax=Thermohalobaculum xanthum TaxID=2753746 RepID=A0A8J7SET5_9RHOB|nr:LacI family DNA-binding transcriptional regulator [Thermohalobaculum xanthum]MBK0398060.1 LacI family DNA-binding transcriptional regulator [Thermohalobaculum xanthum]
MSKPTLADVARLAEVSEMTASRALNRRGYVSAATIERVEAAAAKVGYMPNRLAGALASERTPLVAVVLPTLSNAVFPEVLAGIGAGLAGTGMTPVFGVTEYAPEAEEQNIRELLSWRPAGLIVTGLEHSVAARNLLAACDARVAEIMDTDGTPVSACFGLSHRAVGEAMARHLLDKGYRRFGYVGARLDRDLRARKRRDGFVAVIRAAGATLVHDLAPDARSSMLLGRQLTAGVLAAGGQGADRRVDALYYSNDDMAAGGLMHCLAEGVEVPGRVALAGFNGLDLVDALPLRLTTYRSPRFEIGRQAAAYIAALQAPEIPPRRVIDGELVPGETS